MPSEPEHDQQTPSTSTQGSLPQSVQALVGSFAQGRVPPPWVPQSAVAATMKEMRSALSMVGVGGGWIRQQSTVSASITCTQDPSSKGKLTPVLGDNACIPAGGATRGFRCRAYGRFQLRGRSGVVLPGLKRNSLLVRNIPQRWSLWLVLAGRAWLLSRHILAQLHLATSNPTIPIARTLDATYDGRLLCD